MCVCGGGMPHLRKRKQSGGGGGEEEGGRLPHF